MQGIHEQEMEQRFQRILKKIPWNMQDNSGIFSRRLHRMFEKFARNVQENSLEC